MSLCVKFSEVSDGTSLPITAMIIITAVVNIIIEL